MKIFPSRKVSIPCEHKEPDESSNYKVACVHVGSKKARLWLMIGIASVGASWKGLVRFQKSTHLAATNKNHIFALRRSNMSSNEVWNPLKLESLKELNLDKTLRCGQSFRWRKTPDTNVWLGPIGSTVFALKEKENDVWYSVIHSQNANLKDNDFKNMLTDYFQLGHNLQNLYKTWVEADERFKSQSENFPGIRLLRQDPTECLFSFICSQNNNISRITKMIDSLCSKYGVFLVEHAGFKFYTFPTVERLSKAKENELRELGFGYRARYIITAASQVAEKGDGWLEKLRKASKAEAAQELTSLMGIGKKVADCICLFSLDKLDCIPVDTHVWQIAQAYLPKLKAKKLNDTIYLEIGELFKTKFGPYCGWAHSVLFSAELAFFKKELEGNSPSPSKKEGKNNNNNRKKKQKDEDDEDSEDNEDEEQAEEQDDDWKEQPKKSAKRRKSDPTQNAGESIPSPSISKRRKSRKSV